MNLRRNARRSIWPMLLLLGVLAAQGMAAEPEGAKSSKPDAKQKELDDDLKRLQGEWEFVEQRVPDGKDKNSRPLLQTLSFVKQSCTLNNRVICRFNQRFDRDRKVLEFLDVSVHVGMLDGLYRFDGEKFEFSHQWHQTVPETLPKSFDEGTVLVFKRKPGGAKKQNISQPVPGSNGKLTPPGDAKKEADRQLREDRKRLQGEWEFQELRTMQESDDIKAAASKLKLSISGNRIQIVDQEPGKFTLRLAGKHKQLSLADVDREVPNGKRRRPPKESKILYRFEREQLVLAMRPVGLDSDDFEFGVVVVFKRKLQTSSPASTSLPHGKP